MINPKTQKIDAIKALREFTLDTFGTTAGLKISKDFIDALCVQINKTQMEEVIRKYTPKIW